MSSKLPDKSAKPAPQPLDPRERLAELLGQLLARDWLAKKKLNSPRPQIPDDGGTGTMPGKCDKGGGTSSGS